MKCSYPGDSVAVRVAVTRPTMLCQSCGRNRGQPKQYAQVQRLCQNPERSPSPRSTRHSGRGACATGAYRLEDWLADILPEGAAAGAARGELPDVYDERARP